MEVLKAGRNAYTQCMPSDVSYAVCFRLVLRCRAGTCSVSAALCVRVSLSSRPATSLQASVGGHATQATHFITASAACYTVASASNTSPTPLNDVQGTRLFRSPFGAVLAATAEKRHMHRVQTPESLHDWHDWEATLSAVKEASHDTITPSTLSGQCAQCLAVIAVRERADDIGPQTTSLKLVKAAKPHAHVSPCPASLPSCLAVSLSCALVSLVWATWLYICMHEKLRNSAPTETTSRTCSTRRETHATTCATNNTLLESKHQASKPKRAAAENVQNDPVPKVNMPQHNKRFAIADMVQELVVLHACPRVCAIHRRRDAFWCQAAAAVRHGTATDARVDTLDPPRAEACAGSLHTKFSIVDL